MPLLRTTENPPSEEQKLVRQRKSPSNSSFAKQGKQEYQFLQKTNEESTDHLNRFIVTKYLRLLSISIIGAILFFLTLEYFGKDSKSILLSIYKSGSNNDKEPRVPEIIWLMSFPNSGTSFTLKMIRHITNTGTATNYGMDNRDDNGNSIPIWQHPTTRHNITNAINGNTSGTRTAADTYDGPFWIDPNRFGSQGYEIPTKYVLTKTHCGGRCLHCRPELYIENSTSFLRKCLGGKRTYNSTMASRHQRRKLALSPDIKVVETEYQVDIVKKAIHIIRNPFDNIVSRFHHNYYDSHHDAGNSNFTNSREGFRLFCNDIDKMWVEQEKEYFEPKLLAELKRVPCYIDVYRYAQWHNLAFKATSELNIPTYVLHYENYNDDKSYSKTVSELLQFVEMKHIGSNVEFIKGKQYDYFTKEERIVIKQLMKSMSSSETWLNIQHYFSDISDDYDIIFHNISNSSNNLEKPTENTSTEDEKIVNEVQPESDTSSSKSKENTESKHETKIEYAQVPQVAWLMSFPNSGTSFTLKMIRHITSMGTASNYGMDNRDENGNSVPIWQNPITLSNISDNINENTAHTHDGPFWVDPRRFESQNYGLPSDYVLTKTHCGGRCLHCEPKVYYENEESFLRQCLGGKRSYSVGKRNKDIKFADTLYSSKLVKKAVHLIRNPFDNIVSRFHHQYFDSHHDSKDMANTKEGFRSFCKDLDKQWYRQEKMFFDSKVLKKLKQVPCHADVYRYVQWHNLASYTTSKLGIPTYVLHYENYQDDKKYNKTLSELTSFLHMKQTGDAVEFIKGKEYLDYFKEKERKIIKELMKSMASDVTWQNIHHYFE